MRMAHGNHSQFPTPMRKEGKKYYKLWIFHFMVLKCECVCVCEPKDIHISYFYDCEDEFGEEGKHLGIFQ